MKKNDGLTYGQLEQLKELEQMSIDTTSSQTIAKPAVICRASFKGEVQKATFHLLLEYIDDMKLRNWEFEKHERTDLQNGNVVIDYVLVRHGI